MDETVKDAKEGGMKELLYADDLVLLRESWKQVEMRHIQQKRAMMEKGLKVNVIK